MHLTFLSPEAALIGLGVVVPLVALALAESRARTARSVLRLPPPATRRSAYVLAICAVAALVAAGAAQPMLQRYRPQAVRSDAAAFIVVDTTKSMQAAPHRGSATRFDRSRRLAKRMRSAIADVPTGVVSLTDRALLHLLPTRSTESFYFTLDRALGIERPAAMERGNALGTSLESLAPMSTTNFFPPSAKRRLIVVFTDAETQPFDARRLQKVFKTSRITTILVRVGSPSERIYDGGAPDPYYRPLQAAPEWASLFARAVGGYAFGENDFGRAVKAAKRAAGSGPHHGQTTEVDATPLSSYAFGLAFVPLAFLLWRRNFR